MGHKSRTQSLDPYATVSRTMSLKNACLKGYLENGLKTLAFQNKEGSITLAKTQLRGRCQTKESHKNSTPK